MQLSLQAISDFKAIYQRQFARMLSDDEANQKGLELLEFFQYMSKPIPKDDEPFFLSLNDENEASNQAMYNPHQTVNN